MFAIAVQLPDTALGNSLLAATIWMGFYPLAHAVGLATSRYWAMLGLFVPTVWAISLPSLPSGLGGALTVAVLALAAIGVGVQRWTAVERRG